MEVLNEIMSRHHIALLALIFGISVVMQTVTSDATNFRWPELPTKGFIFGRAATEQDVQDGNAIFVAKVGNTVIGKPLPVTIPQYAYWKKSADENVPVVIIQAEEANGMRLFGFRDLGGGTHVGTGPEMILLGTSHPK